jgi:hypothetical protein
MATIAQDFESALQALKATNQPQTVGTFTFTREMTKRGYNGFRSVQQVQRIDWLTRRTAGELTPRLGGLRYWPTDSVLRTVAGQLAKEDTAEMERRAEAAR